MNRATGLAVVLVMALGCSSFRPVIRVGGYTFRFEGHEYRIESVTPNYMEGYNMLTRLDGEKVDMKAIDREQDGRIDEVTVGRIRLEEATRIYQAGLFEGERLGHVKKRNLSREYRGSDSSYEYILTTYLLARGESYNQLILFSRQNFRMKSVLVDFGMDGKIDRIEEGSLSILEYQKLYRRVLERAEQDKKVVLTNGCYLVVL
ncbi:hypothetical protein JW906_00885 [bacterium]|nr:hypothetical protein [bacterium]